MKSRCVCSQPLSFWKMTFRSYNSLKIFHSSLTVLQSLQLMSFSNNSTQRNTIPNLNITLYTKTSCLHHLIHVHKVQGTHFICCKFEIVVLQLEFFWIVIFSWQLPKIVSLYIYYVMEKEFNSCPKLSKSLGGIVSKIHLS